MDNELFEKCIEHDRKVKERIHALIKEAINITEENCIPFFAVLEGEKCFQDEKRKRGII